MNSLKTDGTGPAMLPNGPPMRRVVFLGHVDSGKSTICGHLLHDVGGRGVSPGIKGLNVNDMEWDALKQRAEELGKGSFRWAFAMDRTREERERGLTIGPHNIGTIDCGPEAGQIVLLDAP